MEERRAEHREGWVLVVEKALRWLKSGGNLPTLMDSARMVVRGERWRKAGACIIGGQSWELYIAGIRN